MTDSQLFIIKILIVSSIVLFVLSLMWCFERINNMNRNPEKHRKSGVSTALGLSGFIFASIWLLRIAVGYFTILVAEPGLQSLNSWEEIINSLFGALRTFGMEEEYAEYILNIKAMVVVLIPSDHLFFSFCQVSLVVYASLLNILAPIAGGAIILEILARIFPELELRLSYLNFRRKKYFFSELNAASLSLAKSISMNKKGEKPIFIFTDTYIDDEKEKEYELLLEAKRYGAICVRDDLLHVVKPKFGEKEYYLMDENEFGNLQTVTGLFDSRNISYIVNSRVYLFVQSDSYVQIEKQLSLRLETEEMKKLLNGREKPIIIPVHGYRNLIHNLLVDIPLYEPLVHKKDSNSLDVTILGSGVIGTEAFLSIYWFGQFMISRLKDDVPSMTVCDLNINIVSKEPENEFWSKIDYVNSDIKSTVEIVGDGLPCSSGKYLEYNADGSQNKPYCKVRYIQSDVKTGSFWDDENETYIGLLDSEYFIVALGSDADNISVAEKLRCSIGKRRIENRERTSNNKSIIAYAVFDSELSSVLNEQKHFSVRDRSSAADIYMHSFGSLEQVYSCENVYMSKNLIWATEAGNAYKNAQYKTSHLQETRKRTQKIDNYEDENYKYWANLSRAMHIKYKVFSLGWIDTSVFDCLSEKDCEKHRQKVKEQCCLYRSLAALYNPGILSEDCKIRYDDIELKKHCLAWLEHRRWNAFTRTLGYRYADVKKILEWNSNHKNMSLRLHSCLVEARLPDLQGDNSYILADFDEQGKVIDSPMFKFNNLNSPDCLDMVTKVKREVFDNTEDFKKYDYYRYEIDNFCFESDIIKDLSSKIANPEDYCNHNFFEDYICCDTKEGSEYMVLIDDVKNKLRKKYKIISEDDEVKGAFEFHKTYYASRINVFFAKFAKIVNK